MANEDLTAQQEITENINKLLAEQVKLIEQVSSAMGKQSGVFASVNKSGQEAIEQQKVQKQNSQELSATMQDNVGGADALANALGRSTAASQSFNAANEKGQQTLKKGKKSSSMFTKAVGGLSKVFNVMKGAAGMGFGAISSGLGILKGGIGMVGGFFKGLMGAAANFANQGGPSIREANEKIRAEFGNFASNEGAAVKSMMGELDTAQKALVGSGTSLYKTLGTTVEQMAVVQGLASDMGAAFTSLKEQVVGATSEMILLSKGAGLSGGAMKQMAIAAKASGGTLKDSLTESAVTMTHLSNKFGVDVKVIGKNFSQMAEDVEHFGHLAPKTLAATAAYASKLGIEVKSLTGLMDSFDTFEGAAKNAGQLAEAFGMNVDVMKMMNAENPAERMDMLRKSFEETGRSVSDLSRHELKLLSQSMGNMPIDELKQSLGTAVDDINFDDFGDAAEEAAEKVSPEEAMQKAAESMEKVVKGMTQLANGPWANFVKGFMQILNRSKLYKDLMRQIGKWLRVFVTFGREIAQALLDSAGSANAILGPIKEIFSIKRITEFKDTVVSAFKDFLLMVKTDPGQAVKNLFEKVMGALKKWFGPTSGAFKKLGKFFFEMVKMAFIMVVKLLPNLLKYIAEGVRTLTKALRDFLKGDGKTKKEVGAGMSGMMTSAFKDIKDVLVKDLWPALKDMFATMFELIKPHLGKILIGILGAVLIKGLIGSFSVAGASGAILGAGKKMMGALGKGIGGKESSTDAPDASQVSVTETIANSVTGLITTLAAMSVKEIFKAGLALMVLSGAFAVGMVAIGQALAIVAGMFSSIPMEDVMKAIVGLAGVMIPMYVMVQLGAKLGELKSQMPNALIGMIGGALVFAVGAVALGLAMMLIVPIWSGLDFGQALKSILLITLTTLVMFPMVVAAALLGLIGPAGFGIALIGMLGAVLVFTAGAGLLGLALSGIVLPAWEGIGIAAVLKVLLLMTLTLIALIPMIIIGAIFGALIIMTGGVLLAAVGIGFLACTKLLIIAGEELGPALKTMIGGFPTDIKRTILVLASIVLTMVALGLLVVAGGVFAAMAVAIGTLTIVAKGLSQAAWFMKKASPHLTSMVKSLNKIPIADPREFKAKMMSIGHIIKAVSMLAEMGIKAAQVSSVGDMFGRPAPRDMMRSISGFVEAVLESITGFVRNMAEIAGQFTPETLKGVKAISGVIGAVAQLAGALIEPLMKAMEIPEGFIVVVESGSGERRMRAITKGFHKMFATIAQFVPGLVSALIKSTKDIIDPDAFGKKAKAVSDLFGGILNLMKVVESISGMGQEDVMESQYQLFQGKVDVKVGERFNPDLITSKFRDVEMIMSSRKTAAFIDSGKDFVNKHGGGEDMGKKVKEAASTLQNLTKVVQTLGTLGHWLGSTSDKGKGAYGLWYLKEALSNMKTHGYFPSDILELLEPEMKKIGTYLGKIKKTKLKSDIYLKPLLTGLLGGSGDKKIVVIPEAVTIHLQVNVKMDAEDIAVGIASAGKKNQKGTYFMVDPRAKGAFQGA